MQFTDYVTVGRGRPAFFLRGQNGALRRPRTSQRDVLTTETSTKLGYSS
jgi:hypothetical protein